MTDLSSKRFAATFQAALNVGGRLSDAQVADLSRTSRAIQDPVERAAADGILALVRHDKELDTFEAAPVAKALGVLLGVRAARLPADLEKALTHAVPQSNVDVKDYDLTFDLSKEGPAFPAHAAITLEKPGVGTLVLEANPDRLDITAVRVGGKDVPFQMKDGRLLVTAPGATALDISYTVKPTDAADPAAYGLIKDKYTGRMWTLTWPYNTGALFPSNSAPVDGATAKVTVKVAGTGQAVGSGTEQGGAFITRKAVPAYAIAFYTARSFETSSAGTSSGGVAVSGYGLDDRVAPDIRAGYRQTAKAALEFYSGWLGAFDYGETLKLVEVEGALGGMEHTAAVAIMMGAAASPDASKETAAHETAHHWFGDNLRIKSWGDFWMSEGFTNYATFRFFEHQDGPGRLHTLLDRATSSVAGALDRNPHALAAPAGTDVNEIFDDIPYQLGPWMLRMLECQLGRATFDPLLRDWYETHRQQAVSTADFVAFAKEKTGKDFAPFFAAWNSITAVPDFKAAVDVEGTHASVSLTANTPVPKGLLIPLVLRGDGGKSFTVMVNPKKRVSVEAPFPVTGFAWDPERTVLCRVR